MRYHLGIIILVTSLLTAQWTALPVRAAGEPPPPASDQPGDVLAPPESAPGILEENERQSSLEKQVLPPDNLPDAISQAGQARFMADAVLLDAQYNPVISASDFASRAQLVLDSFGCPAGVLPVWLGGSGATCTIGYATIQGAINDPKVISGWTVWVPAGVYLDAVTVSKSITLAGEAASQTAIQNNVQLNASSVAVNNLTIQGSIQSNGQAGTLRLQELLVSNPGGPAIYISGHRGSISLFSVQVTGSETGAYLDTTAGSGTVTIAQSFFNGSSGEYGLRVFSKSAVRMDHVSVSNTSGGDGADITFGSSLKINNSQFNYNRDAVSGNGMGYGLQIHPFAASGSVTLSGVQASSNQEDGVKIRSNGSVIASGGMFNQNGGSGLRIDISSGVVTLSDLDLQDNGQDGMVVTSTGSGTVSISKSSMIGNHGRGLAVTGKGGLSVKDVIAHGNSEGGGISLDTSLAASSSYSASIYNVESTNNTGIGLELHTRGTVNLSGLRVMGNTSAGVHVDNCLLNLGSCAGAGRVSMSSAYGVNLIGDNGGAGFTILSKGSVTVNSLDVLDNTGTGLWIKNDFGTASVTVKMLASRANSAAGVEVYSRGKISLDQVRVEENLGSGAILQNHSAAVIMPVTVTNSVFRANAGDGISILSRGSVSFTYVSVSENIGSGAFIDNCLWDGSKCFGTGNVLLSSLTRKNSFNDNGLTGLWVHSKGIVSLKLVEALRNGGDGAYLDIATSTSLFTVQQAIFQGNGGSGLDVSTSGSISLSNVIARQNGGSGARLFNDLAAAGTKIVTVTRGYFDQNGMLGLQVFSRAAITLSTTSALGNQAGGVGLDNCSFDGIACTGTGSVTISGYSGPNLFNDNVDGPGVSITSNGAISLSRVSANRNGLGNDSSGAVLRTYGILSTNRISVTCSSFYNNGKHGIEAALNSTLPLTLTGVGLFMNDQFDHSGDPDLQLASGKLVIKDAACE